jgi:hypothetical protein
MPTTSDLREALAAYNKEVKKREQKHVQKIKQTTLIEVKKKDKLLKRQNKDLEGQPLTRRARVVCQRACVTGWTDNATTSRY